MIEGAKGAAETLAGIDAEIAATERELSTLKAAGEAAARRDAAAEAAKQAKARHEARQRLASLTADRLQLLRELCEGIEHFADTLDRTHETFAPIAKEMLTLGRKASETSALHRGEFERRLAALIQRRLSVYDLGLGKPSGSVRSDDDFSNWLREEERLLSVQVATTTDDGNE